MAKCQNPTGDTVTGEPVTKPDVVALDTGIIMGHRRRTAEIPCSIEEQRHKYKIRYGWFRIRG
jgi:hypothetical protein